MTLRELFGPGPWQIILPWWIGGLALAVFWMSRPALRTAAVASPEICAGLFAALGAMLASIARARYVRRAGAGYLLVIVSIALGAAVGFGAARSVFEPLMERGCACAPLVATRQSAIGSAASYLLPAVLWLVWCRWTIAGLRGAGSAYDAARIVNYSHQLLRVLPFRIGATLIVLGAGLAFVQWRVAVKGNLSADATIERLRGGGAAALQVAGSPALMQNVESARLAQKANAESRLAALDLDGARPLVHDAACALVLPGTPPEPEVTAAEEAYMALDREIDNDLATWRPSAISGRTLLALIPMRVDAGAARLPFLWSAPSPSADFDGAALTAGRAGGTYRNRKVLDAWIFTAQGSHRAVNAAVAMKLLGTSGIDAGLPEVVSRRLGREPENGVTVAGAGAMCAVWVIGDMRVRLGPALTIHTGDAVPTPNSPLWLTYFDTSAIGQREPGALPAELAATYGCDSLQVQSP